MQAPFINFHTHKITNQENVLECVSCGVPIPDLLLLKHPYLQIGIHPWHISSQNEQFKLFQELSQKQNCLTIGEVGLDKVNGESWELQKQIFEKQVKFANQIGKPILLHCVKAFDEILAILSYHNFKPNVFFHGFQGSVEQARQLTIKGYTLSFGSNLLKESSKTIEALKSLKQGTFFLETDDANIGIEKIYAVAASHLSMNLELLKNKLWQDFLQFFAFK